MIDSMDVNGISRSIKNDAKFEVVLKEYILALENLKQRTIDKYGLKQVKIMFPKWFEDVV